jgi:hypothetical protein
VQQVPVPPPSPQPRSRSCGGTGGIARPCKAQLGAAQLATATASTRSRAPSQAAGWPHLLHSCQPRLLLTPALHHLLAGCSCLLSPGHALLQLCQPHLCCLQGGRGLVAAAGGHWGSLLLQARAQQMVPGAQERLVGSSCAAGWPEGWRGAPPADDAHPSCHPGTDCLTGGGDRSPAVQPTCTSLCSCPSSPPTRWASRAASRASLAASLRCSCSRPSSWRSSSTCSMPAKQVVAASIPAALRQPRQAQGWPLQRHHLVHPAQPPGRAGPQAGEQQRRRVWRSGRVPHSPASTAAAWPARGRGRDCAAHLLARRLPLLLHGLQLLLGRGQRRRRAVPLAPQRLQLGRRLLHAALQRPELLLRSVRLVLLLLLLPPSAVQLCGCGLHLPAGGVLISGHWLRSLCS